MSWWQFEPSKKYPFVAPEHDDTGDLRVPLGLFLLVAGCLGMVVTLVALLFGVSHLYPWTLAAGLVCMGLAWVVMPGHPRKPK